MHASPPPHTTRGEGCLLACTHLYSLQQQPCASEEVGIDRLSHPIRIHACIFLEAWQKYLTAPGFGAGLDTHLFSLSDACRGSGTSTADLYSKGTTGELTGGGTGSHR